MAQGKQHGGKEGWSTEKEQAGQGWAEKQITALQRPKEAGQAWDAMHRGAWREAGLGHPQDPVTGNPVSHGKGLCSFPGDSHVRHQKLTCPKGRLPTAGSRARATHGALLFGNAGARTRACDTVWGPVGLPSSLRG